MKKLLTAVLLGLGLTTTVFAADAHSGHDMSAMSMQGAMGVGVIKAIDAKAGSITLAHEPIPALKWPAMVMPFKLAKPELVKGLKAGQSVSFEVQAEGMSGVITAIKPR
jgi:Cu/Ag efflux protein CusF